MKHVVLAAAGHVDHGKTALVRVLTGVDTDTLPEEKRRGLSIETGFAPLDLADGVQISLADVPGHARLIPHMLAGVCGADGFLLVIAADEGVMPQTAEHLDLLTILGIKRGIIALTKTDRVDGETLDRRREEIARWAAARGLSGMPICPVSAVTGRGLNGLRAALAALAEAVQPRETGLPFRLWVDRVFSVAGQGTVVTGTAAQGRAAVGETLCFYPGGTPARVRSIQRHGQPCETLWAGMRGGLNLAGLERQAVRRGAVLAAPDSLTVTDRAAAELFLLPQAPYPVRHNAALHVYYGSEHQVCRVLLAGRRTLEPGERCFAQLRFSRPAALGAGDRCVIRFFSPTVTLGGGVLLDLQPAGKTDPALLTVLAAGGPEARTAAVLARMGDRLPKTEELARRAGLTPEDCGLALEDLERRGLALPLGGRWMAGGQAAALWGRLRAALEDFHQREPLWPGMAREALRAALFPHGSARAWNALLSWYAARYRLVLSEEWVALPGFSVQWTPEYEGLRRMLRERYDRSGLTPPTREEALSPFGRQREKAEQVLRRMALDGELTAIAPGQWVRPHCLREGERRLAAAFARKRVCTLGELRDALGLSRARALVLLDHWDRTGVTRRVAEGRVLLHRGD